MKTFTIKSQGGGSILFRIPAGSVCFAGSRYLSIDALVCSRLIEAFGGMGYSFLTGCASGVDTSFRESLAASAYSRYTLIACAFKARAVKMRGILPLYVVPAGLNAKVALARRTLWMVNKCALLVLFPSAPFGKGSQLAFNTAIMGSKPVFVVSDVRPKDSILYSVYPADLFGVVKGYWCLPPIYETTGLFDDYA